MEGLVGTQRNTFGHQQVETQLTMVRFTSLSALVGLMATSVAYATILYVGVNEVRSFYPYFLSLCL